MDKLKKFGLIYTQKVQYFLTLDIMSAIKLTKKEINSLRVSAGRAKEINSNLQSGCRLKDLSYKGLKGQEGADAYVLGTDKKSDSPEWVECRSPSNADLLEEFDSRDVLDINGNPMRLPNNPPNVFSSDSCPPKSCPPPLTVQEAQIRAVMEAKKQRFEPVQSTSRSKEPCFKDYSSLTNLSPAYAEAINDAKASGILNQGSAGAISSSTSDQSNWGGIMGGETINGPQPSGFSERERKIADQLMREKRQRMKGKAKVLGSPDSKEWPPF